MSFSDYPTVSLIVALLASLALMYSVRSHAHKLILRFSRVLYSQLRLLSRASMQSAQRIRLRNHEVIKALAEALMERQLERRFMRIEKLVERDLANYQKLSASINKQLVTIDEDYVASAKVPEVSPEWVAAVDAIAKLQTDDRNTEVVAKILEDMHVTVQEHHRDALREHRWTVSSRHKVLSRLRTHWRKLDKLLQHIDNNIEVLRLRLRQVDQHMGQFEMLTAGSGQGIMSSMLMRFVSSLCFVMVGIGAAVINWQLLKFPVQAIFPPAGMMEGIALAKVVVGLHIGITLVAATMVSEGLRITHLFPLVTAMTRRGRQAMIFMGAGLLFALTVMEALALIGTPISLTPNPITGVSLGLLVVVGIVMPLALSLVMIPLEYMLHTVRPVMGSLLQLMLHVGALLFRLAASLALQGGRFLVGFYDLLIFVPLRLEEEWRNRQQRKQDKPNADDVPVAKEEPKDDDNSTAVEVLPYGPINPEQRH